MPNKKQNVLDVLDEDDGLVKPDDDGEAPDQDPDEAEEIVWQLARS